MYQLAAAKLVVAVVSLVKAVVAVDCRPVKDWSCLMVV